jgi:hypothetical protein
VNFRDFPFWRIRAVVVLAPVVLASGHSPRSYASIEGWKNPKTWERISASSELGSEHGDHGWKALEEKNRIGTPNEGIVFLEKNEIFTPLHGCVTNWYQSMVTTLGLLGLMDESLKNRV